MSILETYRKLEDYFFTLGVHNEGLLQVSINNQFIDYVFYTNECKGYTSNILVSHYKFDEYLEKCVK